jgi:TolB protein
VEYSPLRQAIVLTLLCVLPTTTCAEEVRPTCWIGYTEGRNDLPDGQFANWVTNRASIVRADGSGRRVLAKELTRKPHSWTQFAGWRRSDAAARASVSQ